MNKEIVKKINDEINQNIKMFGCMEDFEALEIKEFIVSDSTLWENHEEVRLVQRRMEYIGIRFSYGNGKVEFHPMPEEEWLYKEQLKNAAHRRHYMETKIQVNNKLMDQLIAQLPGYKEINVRLPYETKSSDVVIFMFPKDEPEKDWAGFENCDVLVYDRNYEEYFKIKTMGGFTEIFTNDVAVRTGLSDGGYMVRLRETAIIIADDTKITILNDEVQIKEKFTEEELKQALFDVYGKEFMKYDNV